MSQSSRTKQSVELFETYRAAKTTPPPAALGTDLRTHANRIRKMAAAMLAEANDLDRAADVVEGK